MNEGIPRLRPVLHVTAAEAPYHRALQVAVAALLPQAGFGPFHIAMPDRKFAGNAEFDPADVQARGPGIELHLLQTRAFKKKHGNLWPTPRLWSLVNEINPAVIWSHEYSLFNWPALFYAKLRKRPLIISTEIGKANLADMGTGARLTRRLFGGAVSGIIAHSPAAMVPVEGVPPDRVVRAWYASGRALAPQTSRPPDRKLRLVFLGHLIPRKGVDLLLAALQEAEALGGEFQLTLIGATTPWITEVLQSFRGRTEIMQAGFQQSRQLDELLAAQDVFVLPSRYDTYGAVVHEAASCGLALVVSKNAGASALAEPPNGFVIDPEDRAGLAAVLHQLSSSPELVATLKSKALGVAQEYSVAANALRVCHLLKS